MPVGWRNMIFSVTWCEVIKVHLRGFGNGFCSDARYQHAQVCYVVADGEVSFGIHGPYCKS